MKLNVGQAYKRRDGGKSVVVATNPFKPGRFIVADRMGPYTVDASGMASVSVGDLIEEWREPATLEMVGYFVRLPDGRLEAWRNKPECDAAGALIGSALIRLVEGEFAK